MVQIVNSIVKSELGSVSVTGNGVVAIGTNLPTALKIGAAVVCGTLLIYQNFNKVKEAASYAYSIIKGTPPQGPND